ncbi:MAG: M23 family metallopeptidase [Actinobacteria bacterium]|nr:MAG: M23 family metallopeptidase [Actinomycetota bacterium]
MRRTLLCLALLSFLAAPGARGASLDLVQPAPGPITRHFEPPPTPYAAGHRGIDFGAPIGTRVVAAAAGTVSFAGQVARAAEPSFRVEVRRRLPGPGAVPTGIDPTEHLARDLARTDPLSGPLLGRARG